MNLNDWADEVVRLVRENNWTIRKACLRVKFMKARYEKDVNRSESEN